MSAGGLRIIAAGAVAGLLPAVLMFGAASTGTKLPMGVLVVIAIPLVGLFPLSFAYVVVRHRVFGIRLILRRGLTYALVSRGFLLAEAALIFLALLGVAGTRPPTRAAAAEPAVSTAGTAVADLHADARHAPRESAGPPGHRPAVLPRRVRRPPDPADLSRAVRRMASYPDRLLSHASGEIVAALHPRNLASSLPRTRADRLQPLDHTAHGCCDAGSGTRRPQAFRAVRGRDEGARQRGPCRCGRRGRTPAARRWPVL